jgi:hypothetical protein
MSNYYVFEINLRHNPVHRKRINSRIVAYIIAILSALILRYEDEEQTTSHSQREKDFKYV